MKGAKAWTLLFGFLLGQVLLYSFFCARKDVLSQTRPILRTLKPKFYDNDNAIPLRTGNVAIIGASGYVGSRLFDYLKGTEAFKVVGYDRDPRDPDRASLVNNLEAKDMTDEELAEYAVVVYFGGLTGRKVCEGNEVRVQQENVHDTVKFASRMKEDQLLIFASTSAIGEGYGNIPFRESDEPKLTLMDAYTRSLWERELALRHLHDQGSAPRMIGLRFGTVLGVSPSQRTEMVMMALVRSVFLTGKIDVRHGESYRGFAWLEDICRAIETVIER